MSPISVEGSALVSLCCLVLSLQSLVGGVASQKVRGSPTTRDTPLVPIRGVSWSVPVSYTEGWSVAHANEEARTRRILERGHGERKADKVIRHTDRTIELRTASLADAVSGPGHADGKENLWSLRGKEVYLRRDKMVDGGAHRGFRTEKTVGRGVQGLHRRVVCQSLHPHGLSHV